MKRYFSSGLVAIVMAATPALAASAPSAADKVAEKMLGLTQSVDAMKAQIDSVMGSLNSLTAGSGDLVAMYDTFGKQVDKTESMYKKAKSEASKARSQRDSYIKKWEASQQKIQNEELRKTAEARKAELLPIIEKLKESASGAEQAFLPFLQDLKDIRLFLGNDLNPTGVGKVKESLQPKCATSASTVKTKLDEATGALKELAGRIKPAQA